MKAVVHDGSGDVVVREVADAVLQDPGDALVRVERAAVCGTDLHLLAHRDGVPAGTVLGHEFVGEVVEVGPAVTAHQVGARVAGADFAACGRCWWCRRGHHWECPERRFFGTGTSFGPPLPGAQAELVRVPFADATLHPVPAGVSADRAVFLGDTAATGYAAVRRTGLEPGDTVAVVGGGPVGQLCSLMAQACGAGTVLLVEPVADRRAVAAAEGAVAVTPDQARDVLDAVTDGRGADAVIDAVGGGTGLDLACGLVRRAGTVVSVGVPASTHWSLPVQRAFTDELTLAFAVGDFLRDGAAVTALVRSGVVDPLAVRPDTVGLDAAPQAYLAMIERRTLKALLAF